jgi:hypothetical protein
MLIYTYIHIHTYIYIHTYKYIYICIYLYSTFMSVICSDFLSQEFRDFSQKGILSGDQSVNPLAHNWNRVMAAWRRSELESWDQL